MKIRKYQTADYKEIADLFYETVHSVCANDYTAEELEAWAPAPIDYEKWQKRLEKRKPFVVIINHLIVGFAELEKDGHIDCFYVHKNYQGQGVGSLLMSHIENLSNQKGLDKLYSEVSITAKPFFEKHGFKTAKKNIVRTNNQKLTNFIMRKHLDRRNGA